MDQRLWSVEYARESRPERTGEKTWTIRNVRDFSYAGKHAPTEQWKDVTFDPRTATHGWYYMASFTQFGPLAKLFGHTSLGFACSDGTELVFSLDARRKESTYDPFIKGMFGGYAMTFLFTTRRDMEDYRRVQRGQSVDRYPLTLSHDALAKVIVACLEKTHTVTQRATPMVYNTLSYQCTNILFDTMNTALDEKIPWSLAWHVNGLSPHLLASRGLIDLSKKEEV